MFPIFHARRPRSVPPLAPQTPRMCTRSQFLQTRNDPHRQESADPRETKTEGHPGCFEPDDVWRPAHFTDRLAAPRSTDWSDGSSNFRFAAARCSSAVGSRSQV